MKHFLRNLDNQALGKYVLNAMAYLRVTAESASPSVIHDALSAEEAIKGAQLSEYEQRLVFEHYTVTGGDASQGERFDALGATSYRMGALKETTRLRLLRIQERVGKQYREIEEEGEL